MSIHQEIMINSDPATIYDILTDSNKFSAFTAEPADIATEEGGVFTVFGNKLEGRNIELKPNHRIVQAWRVGGWPEGVYSLVSITLDQQDNQTKITLNHSGFPEESGEHLEGGWHKMYWEPLKSHLE